MPATTDVCSLVNWSAQQTPQNKKSQHQHKFAPLVSGGAVSNALLRFLDVCDITDADIDDGHLAACFTAVGPSNILELWVRNASVVLHVHNIIRYGFFHIRDCGGVLRGELRWSWFEDNGLMYVHIAFQNILLGPE